uniref:FA complementation group F n=2 Tax=Anolis carolinensis TaxID=28377 RepID=G1KQP1_ANOCA|nr:PREDICTED: Fanconi anemia group F protein [Anolis carolinensis]|eukprot:XP_008104449.1 PREDICTED: Fanconi anemia group F protein [Anolis carolinensis]
MEALLSQAEQLPGLVAASRSPAVRSWDPATVSRALGWARAFRHLHRHLRDAGPGLREAAERSLRRRGLHGGLGQLGRSPSLLSFALLENRALPSPARGRLLRILLLPSGGGEEELLLPLSARRKAAAQLLPACEGPADRAQAQLLLSRLREEEEGSGLAFLDRLPCGPALYKAVASALLEPGGESEAQAVLLPWLLRRGGGARLEAFCRLLPAARLASLCARHPGLLGPYFGLLAAWGGRLAHDPLLGEWRSTHPEVTWSELRERIRLLSQEPEPLASAIREHIRKLKGQDGDFEAPGLSVWTDLLIDLERPDVEKPGRDHSQFVTETWSERDLSSP